MSVDVSFIWGRWCSVSMMPVLFGGRSCNMSVDAIFILGVGGGGVT